MLLFSQLFRLIIFLSEDIIKIFPYIFLLILSAFLSLYLMITWSHDEPYSVQIFFFGIIISSVVIIDLENPPLLSKNIILRA